MAKKKDFSTLKEMPELIDGSLFYGLELDEEQEAFANAIWDKTHDIIFANCRAGTGKTTVSLGVANMLVQFRQFDRIIYVCSPCGNESRMGFLPGTLTEKAEVYYEALYSAMQTLGINPFTAILDNSLVSQKYEGDGYIKPITDVYLRGCNLDNAILILDEAENFTTDIMRKVLTRACKNTKIICIGHDGQIDLANKESSGFIRYLDWFKAKNDDRVAICELTHVHRSWVAEYADLLR